MTKKKEPQADAPAAETPAAEGPDGWTLRKALKARGFVMNARPEQCEQCSLWSYEPWSLRNSEGSMGGRDIFWCSQCAHTRSWKRGGVGKQRVEETGFSLRAFLGL